MSDLERYFRKGQWPAGGGETISGPGSTLAYTARLRESLPELLLDLNVQVFLDGPCGDFNWMQAVDLNGISYIGIDIVKDIVEDNARLYGNDKRRFIHGDITTDELPAADLMMCRDCLFHLPYRSIFSFLVNFLSSDIPCLLLTSHHRCERNEETPRISRFRPLNMQIAPFHFPEPRRWIMERGRGIGLWTDKDVRAVLMRYMATTTPHPRASNGGKRSARRLRSFVRDLVKKASS